MMAMGFFKGVTSRIVKGLARSRQTLAGGLRALVAGRALDDALIAEIEARLIQADVG